MEFLLRVEFWIYAAMACIFVSGVLLCVLPVLRVRRALRRGCAALSKRRTDGSYLYDHPDFLHCKALDAYWARFVSNLRTLRRSNGACEVGDFINHRTAIQEPGHAAYGDMIPGVLTTLGILGSFYGIVRGLSTLDLATSESMSQSIVVLISGMRTAFNTSIAGAVLAISFQLLRRLTIGRAERTLRAFVSGCQTQTAELLTPDATAMQTLHAILDELRAIRGLLERN